MIFSPSLICNHHHRRRRDPTLLSSRSVIVAVKIHHRCRRDLSSSPSRSVTVVIEIRHRCHRDLSSWSSKSVIVAIEIHHRCRRDLSPSPSTSSNMVEVAQNLEQAMASSAFKLSSESPVDGDKLLGKDCNDIDIALDNMMGSQFVDKGAAASDEVKHALATKISRERIGTEFDLMISGNQPVKAVAQISDLTLFRTIFSLPPDTKNVHLQLCKRRDLFKSVENTIVVKLGLEKVWEVRQSVNGKQVMKELELKGGPLAKEWLEKAMAWELAHPSRTAQECIDWLKQTNSKMESHFNSLINI
ncbi:putative CCA tRNA nucleotidyltransferase 2 [Senna tora]|uniref:Putative CCA tRNA nucleotidyltransferase 2 n=1 Tax=Senna tora TaxID=362788 RepID=A0A835CHX8_9FABA|nr:putative CCA tRNA nucleotidyltransferase 2 [Senna tora]